MVSSKTQLYLSLIHPHTDRSTLNYLLNKKNLTSYNQVTTYTFIYFYIEIVHNRQCNLTLDWIWIFSCFLVSIVSHLTLHKARVWIVTLNRAIRLVRITMWDKWVAKGIILLRLRLLLIRLYRPHHHSCVLLLIHVCLMILIGHLHWSCNFIRCKERMVHHGTIVSWILFPWIVAPVLLLTRSDCILV